MEQVQLGYLHIFSGLSLVLLDNTLTEYRRSVFINSSRCDKIIRHLPVQVYKCGVIGQKLREKNQVFETEDASAGEIGFLDSDYN